MDMLSAENSKQRSTTQLRSYHLKIKGDIKVAVSLCQLGNQEMRTYRGGWR
jgi:hypothetical protein